VGGGGPESTGKTSKPELPVPSALSGAQLILGKKLRFCTFYKDLDFNPIKRINLQIF
jgi:hypothetical protein